LPDREQLREPEGERRSDGVRILASDPVQARR
jgi:hypothetical protein